jgi:hypothetical protein
MTADLPPLDALGEFKNAVWRIVTYTSYDLGDPGTGGYLLSDAQVDEIADEAHEYAKGLAADERAKVQHAIDRVAQTAAAAQAKAVETALLALAAELETRAGDMRTDIGRSAHYGAANLARIRAAEIAP